MDRSFLQKFTIKVYNKDWDWLTDLVCPRSLLYDNLMQGLNIINIIIIIIIHYHHQVPAVWLPYEGSQHLAVLRRPAPVPLYQGAADGGVQHRGPGRGYH